MYTMSPNLQNAIVRAAFTALEKTEQAYEKGESLHIIRALEKNSFAMLFRSFFETEVSGIVLDNTLINEKYVFYEYHLPDIDLRICADQDLYRPAKNNYFDDMPLLEAAGICIKRKGSRKSKGFIVFKIHEHQLIQLSVVSRIGDFPEITLYKKERNRIILDSLSAMRDSTEKRVEFALKENRKKSLGDKA